ncbi:MAG: FAD/NAD(P)-binding protein [Ignavibacteriaceae bacterium]
MKEIAIIGAGLSGTLLAMNLLKQKSTKPINIKLIDRNSETEMGPAYSTSEDYLLNVPVEKMGALSKEPEHFFKWALKKNIAVKEGDYLPRKLYREYIKEIFQRAFDEKAGNISFERIKGEAVDVKIESGKPKVFMSNGDEFPVDKLVLALGNAPPLNPDLKSKDYLNDKRYIQNPWDKNIFEKISSNHTIFFIGTGQTMVDLVAGLNKRKHRGRLICISRRGLLPLSQKKVEAYPSFFNELKGLNDILLVFSVVKKHIRIAEMKGIDPRAVIDSLRPHTQTIWRNLPTAEKQRFLRHVFRYWEIIRSRIPPESDELVNKLRSSGQMEVLTGRITEIIPDKKMEIKYAERGTSNQKSVSVDFVINCIGPCQDYERIDQPLIKKLLSRRLIQCDPVHLGINALPEGNVIQEDGNPSNIIFTIGLPLKGIVWESLAAPEIRAEA